MAERTTFDTNFARTLIDRKRDRPGGEEAVSLRRAQKALADAAA